MTGIGPTVQGNIVGLNADGTAAIGNAYYGIADLGGGNLIGGTQAGMGNVVSGNLGAGVYISGPNPGGLVQGDLIGTDISGTAPVGNGPYGGVWVDVNGQCTLGGTSARARNVISGNDGPGVFIQGRSLSKVLGNFIGVGVNGTTKVANSGNGISITGSASDDMIGDGTPAGRNVISGNGLAGIALADAATSGNAIQGNLIGTDISGNRRLANGARGITMAGAGPNAIGGTVTGQGNVISGNVGEGIGVFASGGISSGTIIQGNLIGLGADGATTMGNTGNGVSIQASGVRVGGSTPGARNIISGNSVFGVYINDRLSTQNQITGNFIGTDRERHGRLGEHVRWGSLP